MSLKWKFYLGTGLLYAVMVGCMALCLLSVKRLSDAGTKVIKENYRSLAYVHEMDSLLVVLGTEKAGPGYYASLKKLRLAVSRQQGNITEPGEAQATARLDSTTEALAQAVRKDSRTAILQLVADAAGEVEAINLNAIRHKSDRAEHQAVALLNESVVATTIAFLLVFTFLLSFPAAIITPIEQLTRLIGRVAEGDYSQRLDESRRDEIGQLGLAFNHMSAELQRYRQSSLERLMANQRRTDFIINHLPDPLIVADAEWNVLFFNQAAQKVLGAEPAQMHGKRLPEMAQRNDLLLRWMAPIINDETKDKTTGTLSIVVDGKERYFEPGAFAIREERDTFATIGYVLLLTDITHFKELDMAKTDFLATISHELKTPLSSIDLSLRLLRNTKTGSLTEGQKDVVDGIDQETKRLIRLVTELLNTSQIESGQLQLNIVSVRIVGIIQEAVEAVQTSAQEKQVEIDIQIQAELPKVFVDPEKTRWVLTNLLTNALKHTLPKERITIQANQISDHVQISVHNPGAPIPPEEQRNIFTRYYQADKTSSLHLPSSGLGLAICKQIIEAQNGRVWVESKVKDGATFSLTLPC